MSSPASIKIDSEEFAQAVRLLKQFDMDAFTAAVEKMSAAANKFQQLLAMQADAAVHAAEGNKPLFDAQDFWGVV